MHGVPSMFEDAVSVLTRGNFVAGAGCGGGSIFVRGRLVVGVAAGDGGIIVWSSSGGMRWVLGGTSGVRVTLLDVWRNFFVD